MSEPQFTLVGQFTYSYEAFIYKAKLESEGIATQVRDNNTIDTDPMVSNAIGGVKLFVNTSQAAEALEIISQIQNTNQHTLGEIAKCPNCNSENIKLYSGIHSVSDFFALLVSFLVMALPVDQSFRYYCGNCSHKFKLKQT